MRRALAPLLLLVSAACAQPPGQRPAPCILPALPLLIAVDVLEVSPGAVDTLALFTSASPGALEPIPAGCRVRWSVTRRAPAAITRTEGVLSVEADAPAGATFVIGARVLDRATSAVARVRR